MALATERKGAERRKRVRRSKINDFLEENLPRLFPYVFQAFLIFVARSAEGLQDKVSPTADAATPRDARPPSLCALSAFFVFARRVKWRQVCARSLPTGGDLFYTSNLYKKNILCLKMRAKNWAFSHSRSFLTYDRKFFPYFFINSIELYQMEICERVLMREREEERKLIANARRKVQDGVKFETT